MDLGMQVIVKKILGDNYGVTTLPTIDFGSGEKKMQAFSGVGTLAVNSASKNQVAASSLAQYLSNADSQKNFIKIIMQSQLLKVCKLIQILPQTQLPKLLSNKCLKIL